LLREGLSNVVRHAECQVAKVLLALQEDTIILRVEDQGRGFTPSLYLTGKDDKTSGHHGLRNLSYRTKHLGGTLRIDSAPGKGTRLLFQIPVPILPGEEDSEHHADKPSRRS
jgi:signal transduction histidine kinase